MPTSILTFISMINTTSESLKVKKSIFKYFNFYEQLVELSMKKVYNPRAWTNDIDCLSEQKNASFVFNLVFLKITNFKPL